MEIYDDVKKPVSCRELILLVVAISARVLAFSLTLILGQAVVAKYMEKTWLTLEEEKQYIDSIRSFISDNRVSFEDSGKVEGWVRENSGIAVLVYGQEKNTVRYFMDESKRIRDRLKYKEEINIYGVDFADGAYGVSVVRTDDSNLYYVFSAFSGLVGFAVFLGIFFAVTYRRDKYITHLKEEMDLIAVGNLNCEVTVKGTDELAELAENLNQMRKSLLSHIQEEERLAHNIRTPLTSIMLYAEILEKGKYHGEDQMAHCIGDIRSGAEKISKITEELMRHMRNEEDPHVVESSAKKQGFREYLSKALTETAESLRVCGFDEVEEIGDFENNHFLSDNSPEETMSEGRKLAISRVLENIRPNIIRYADMNGQVVIFCGTRGDNIALEFRNGIKKDSAQVTQENSMGIGLKSVVALMEDLGGSCWANEEGMNYIIRLTFPKDFHIRNQRSGHKISGRY